MKFALAAAGRRDSPYERELGPIHLIKLVYLADVAYAQRNQGQTFTGAPWRFYHYGPWSEEVWKQIEPVVHALNADERTFSSKYKEDHRRWSIQDAEQVEELITQLDRELPTSVSSAVNRGIREYGTDTTSLLHEVYRTKPMLNARPGSYLDFHWAVVSEQMHEDTRGSSETVQLTAKQEKKQREALRGLRARVQQQLKERLQPVLVEPPTPPRYDETFHQVVQWLDTLAGESAEKEQGQIRFSDDMWTAPSRGGSGED